VLSLLVALASLGVSLGSFGAGVYLYRMNRRMDYLEHLIQHYKRNDGC
jgi:hypothetical protein